MRLNDFGQINKTIEALSDEIEQRETLVKVIASKANPVENLVP